MSRNVGLSIISVCLAVAWGVAVAENAVEVGTDRLIVKWRVSTLAQSKPGEVARAKARVLAKLGRPDATLDASSSDGSVLDLGTTVSALQARQLAQVLESDPLVEYAEPNRRVRPFAIPNDPDLTKQWHLQSPSTLVGATDAVGAWATTRGSNKIVVAVVDTGIINHADLAANVLPGYDMISSTTIAGDGNRRDADATDVGDWTALNECGDGGRAQSSSWHGTHVAGIIAAAADNSSGGSGVAPLTKVLPVRAMGKCGGYVSDVADGIRWAAGLTVSGVPANAHPAKVINLSLGSVGDCSRTEQRAIDDAVAAGAVVVVAAGNSGEDAADTAPANCANVTVVTAVGKRGAMANYSNFGSAVTLAAPGGDTLGGIYATYNTGYHSAVADSYDWLQGTSMAAPQVSGVAALMLAANNKLSPAQIKQFLIASVRPFPTSTGQDCTTAKCGAGLLDAAGAVRLSSNNALPTVELAAAQRVNPGVSVALSATATDSDGQIVSYLWRQLDGTKVQLDNADHAQTRYIAPASGRQRFEFIATDNNGAQGLGATTVTVNQFPSANAGGVQRVLPGSVVTLSGAASKDDSKIVSYQWQQSEGPSVTLKNALSATPSFLAPAQSSELKFSLTVVDDGGLSASIDGLVIADVPPVANAGLDSVVIAGASARLDGSASLDPEGKSLRYQWVQTKGATLKLSGAVQAQIDFIAGHVAEELEFQLTVTDVKGNISTDTVAIAISGAPGLKTPAVINANEGTPVAFDVVVTTTLNRGATLATEGIPGGATYDLSLQRFTWSKPLQGRYSLTFTARDSVDSSLATQRVTVIDVAAAQRAAQSSTSSSVAASTTTPGAVDHAPKCFIATAAFGTGMANEVRYLRALRDQFLLTNTPGRWFVNFYYSVSPPIADFLRRHDGLRAGVRAALEPLVALAKWIVSDDSYDAQTAQKA